MEPFVVLRREFNPCAATCDRRNQEEVVDKLDIFRSLFAVHSLGRILLQDFALEPFLRIRKARFPVRDIPTASRDKESRILRNQVVILRRTKRRVLVGIFDMFKNQGMPVLRNELLDNRILLAEIVHIQKLPAEIPAYQAQVHLDVAVPVDP